MLCAILPGGTAIVMDCARVGFGAGGSPRGGTVQIPAFTGGTGPVPRLNLFAGGWTLGTGPVPRLNLFVGGWTLASAGARGPGAAAAKIGAAPTPGKSGAFGSISGTAKGGKGGKSGEAPGAGRGAGPTRDAK